MALPITKLLLAFTFTAEVQAQLNLTNPTSGTVYLVRHGEKDSKGCESNIGMRRANNMYDVMKSKFEVPSYVFAYHYSGSECQRCDQTARPIAKKIGMDPDTHYGHHECSTHGWGNCGEWADAVKAKLSSHSVVFVVAEHRHINPLAYDLGVSSSKLHDWSGSDYNTVYKVGAIQITSGASSNK